MSEFHDLLTEGFDAFLDQMTDADGDAIGIVFNGLTKPCVPATSARSKELRDSGLWEQGMVVVEMRRTDVATMVLVDRSVVQYGPPTALRWMKVFIFDEDPADPAIRITLQPDRAPR